MNKSKYAIITGRVQGVGFRAWTASTASRMGLTGWVRNRSDGTVEALLHGDEELVDQMVRKLYQGPILSRVTEVTTVLTTDIPEEQGFVTKPTV